jgi:hypothetical protein
MENFKNPLAEAKFKRKKRNPITASSRTDTLLLPQQLVKGLPQKALTELLTVDLFPRTDLLLKLSRDLSCSQQALFHFSTGYYILLYFLYVTSCVNPSFRRGFFQWDLLCHW